jgi:hypothetical protein
VDAVVEVDETLESVLEHPQGTPGEVPASDRPSSKRDLAAAITWAMQAGDGDERITTAELSAELEATLTADTMQMGGQAGIMTNLFASLGASPVVYTYLLSETQRSMLDRPESVRYHLVEDGLVWFVPVDDAPTTERTKMNWIFEFREGSELFGVRATGNTRFIAASRPPEFNLDAGALNDAIDQVGTRVDGALLAGYHNLTLENAEAGYEETLRHARDVLRRLRSEREIPVHVEYAVTHDADLQRGITETILPEGAARFQIRRRNDYGPHGDTHLRAVKQFEPETLIEGFDQASDRLFSAIASKASFRRPVTVAIDITTIPYYGDVEGMSMVSRMRGEEKRAFKFATLSIVGENTPLVLAVEPIRESSAWDRNPPNQVHRVSGDSFNERKNTSP